MFRIQNKSLDYLLQENIKEKAEKVERQKNKTMKR